MVTGASAGIGAATALRLASDGFTVYGVARRADLLNDLAGVRPIQADITNDAQRRDCVNRVLDETGRIDVLVNNAGSGLYGALEDIPLETAQKLFEVNLFAHARLIQLFLPTFREQGKGTIMNVSSIAGRIYAPFGCWYHASKFALEGLSDSLRIELKPYGVRVVLIEPGAIDTDGLRGAGESLRSNSGSTYYSTRANAAARSMGELESVPATAVANKIALIANRRRIRTRYIIGKGAKAAVLMYRIFPDWLLDRLIEVRLRQHMEPVPACVDGVGI
ncbi:SDR family NAD(P)-dependent oxidoreductase [Mycobacterium sp.]|uniref:SDR family NAD(P)-dependent oxidoreductase n=1 Tax=Mycobacterium sp. TaxID=1785 RepID=UPI003BAD94D9